MIAEPGSAMIVELASQLAVPPYNRRHNPFVTGLLFKNLRPGPSSIHRGLEWPQCLNSSLIVLCYLEANFLFLFSSRPLL